MKRFLRLAVAIAVVAVVAFGGVLLAGGCGQGRHFLPAGEYRNKVHQDFLDRKEMAGGRGEQLFAVLERDDLSHEQREALEFLYAYLPLVDLAEYDGDFFLDQVNGAFRARDHFDWGGEVPDYIFRHYVLVPRVNNEYLDDSRNVFFEQLKDRIDGMTMEQAALEINHWCHEKVTYRGSDRRTLAPLATVKTSWGRCGEESAFTTAALRAVGIPARQVYTPRWAHTDSNHAWVEVWTGSEWHYLGACEPEPELDVAWFSGPVKRMMMGHTKVIGLYDGPEEAVYVTKYYSELNLTGNYADTRRLNVTVVDTEGNTVEGAEVKFDVYNYGQFNPIVKLITDGDGKTAITTGLGDLLVWASRGDSYGYVKSGSADNDVTVTLDRVPGTEYVETIIMNVPKEKPVKELSREQTAANAVRLAYEDSVRNAYMQTFANEEYARELAARTGLDTAKTWEYLHAAQGNWRDVETFIEANAANTNLFPFLASMLEKDLRDTPAQTLGDHLNGGSLGVGNLNGGNFGGGQGSAERIDNDMFVRYVLSPRIGIELIRPWRAYFLGGDSPKVFATPEEIVKYVAGNIAIYNDQTYAACYPTPQGVDEMGVADLYSRDIYFVALCRASGIPARLEPASRKPQYFSGGRWNDAQFGDPGKLLNRSKERLTLLGDPKNIIEPGYESHYTLAYFADGDFHTLDFYGDPAFDKFPVNVELEEGYYRLMVGSRANDGSITIETRYFNVAKGRPVRAAVALPAVGDKIFVKGIVDMNTIVELDGGGKATLKELAKGKGLALIFADPDKEPTKHILQDLPQQAAELEEWGGGVLFMVPDDKLSKAFDASQFGGLPSQVVWGVDRGRGLLNAAAGAIRVDFSNNFPLTLYINSNGGVLYSEEGYRIGIGEGVLKTIMLERGTK